MVEHIEVVFRVGHFNYFSLFFFFFFFLIFLNNRTRRGSLYPGNAFRYGVGGKDTLWYWTENKETRRGYIYLMKTQVPCLNDALRHLKSLGYGGVAENDVCCTKLAVRAYEHLDLQDLVQTRLVHEIEVRHNSVLICRTMKRNRKISLAKVEPIKGKFTYNYSNLDLRPHLVSPLLLGWEGHHTTPLIQSRSLYLGLY